MALCGRTPEPSQALAQRLGVSAVRFDWRSALDEFRPDIVAITTPAGPHRDMAVAAAEAGCHVACEKPLGVNAAEAREMLAAGERKGVKHAYAATGCYAPFFGYVRSLLSEGVIGMVREIDYMVHDFNLPPLVPRFWVHQLESGGGFLNNFFTHLLQQVLMLTGGTVTAAMGTVTRHIDRAPIGRPVHDFREGFGAMLTPEQAATADWGAIDIDLGFALMLQLRLPAGQMVLARFTKPEDTHYPYPSYFALHGSAGTLYLSQTSSQWTIQRFDVTQGAWTDVVVPPTAVLAPDEDQVQHHWNQFFQEFVADVRGEGYGGYPTFHDGWVAAEVMDIARSGRGWIPVPEHGGDQPRQT
ncbi:MAG: Gfo/Idh/MocA family oxidoreductase [Chloroflexota bacterium]|nr:Gfo/Idh/MocA family oxidoreductase [Chloroflexota bacterium]